MNLALLSCRDLPDWEKDDRFFQTVLSEHGVDWTVVSWDETCDWSTFDGVLIRTTWDYVDRRVAFVLALEEISTQTVLLNPIEVVRWNIEKTYLKDLEDRGVPIAPTVWILKKEVSLIDVMQERGWSKGFLKPVVGACASNTKRFSISEVKEAQHWLDRLLEMDTQMMLQPYIETVETEGEYSAIFFADKLSHCVQKIPVTGDYRVQDDFGASDQCIDPNEVPEMLLVAHQTLSVLHSRFENLLITRIDFLHMMNEDWVVNEVEMIEPSLFFRHSQEEAPRLLLQELCSGMGYESIVLTPEDPL